MLDSTWIGVKRLLFARVDNAGDVLLCGPSLRALKENLPGVHITLLASPSGARVAPLLPWVDEVWEQRVVWQDVGGRMPLDPKRELQFITELRHRHFDAAIISTSFSQSPQPLAYACYLAGVPLRLGQSKEFAGSVLHPALPALPDNVHQAERTLQLLEWAGFVVADRYLSARVDDAARASLETKMQDAGLEPGEPFVLVHPVASCSARGYPAHLMARAAALLRRRLFMPVVLSGEPRDAAVGAYVQSAAGAGVYSLIGKTTTMEFGALVERAAVTVCNNTFTLHLADAFSRPQVVLYSGADLEEQWRPRRSASILLRRGTRCYPCYAFRCPFDLECLSFTPHEVARTVEELLIF